MSAYIVVQVDVHDAQRYEAYKGMVQATLEPYSGRFLVRGGAVENLEGVWLPGRFVILEFPDSVLARAWWGSPEYAAAKKLRQETTHTEMILVEGV